MSKTITYELNDNVVKKLQDIVGGGGIDIAPLVVFKAGEKFKVDFSVGDYIIAYDATNATGIISECIPSGSFSSGYPQILIQANEGKTQLVASLADSYSYQSVTNQVVIYEGDLTGEPLYTSNIDYAWPTVEFTLNQDFEDGNIVVASINDGYSVTN